MPPLRNCCCCDLKTGVLIIAILGWIFTLIKVFGLVSIVAQSQPQQTPSVSILHGNVDFKVENNSGSSSVLAYQIVYSLISLTCCILLLVGALKGSRYYFLPWMILNFIEYLLVSLTVIIGFIILFATLGSVGLLVFLFLLFISICVLCWYLWVVVFSYYAVLRDGETAENGNSANNPPAYTKEGNSVA